MSDFDSLMARHEMGVAYKAITSAMGPSPQLVAFVNYANVGNENFGLESFNIMDQHQKILNDIDADPALEIALENLTDTVRKTSKYLIGAGWTGVLASFFVSGPLCGMSIAAIVAGHIGKKVTDIATTVPSYQSFIASKAAFDECLTFDIDLAKSMPNDFSEESWKAFDDKVVDDTKESTKVLKKIGNWNYGAFDESGWTAERFSEAVKWLRDNAKRLEELEKAYGHKLESVEVWLSEDHGPSVESRSVLKHIANSVGLSSKLFHPSVTCLTDVKHLIEAVGHHFEETKK